MCCSKLTAVSTRRRGNSRTPSCRGTRHRWKLSVVSAAEVERVGIALALPKDATHAMIFIEGNHAIEQSGLLDGRPGAYGQTLQQLSLAADEFERTLERLIHVAQAARLVIMVCTMFFTQLQRSGAPAHRLRRAGGVQRPRHQARRRGTGLPDRSAPYLQRAGGLTTGRPCCPGAACKKWPTSSASPCTNSMPAHAAPRCSSRTTRATCRFAPNTLRMMPLALPSGSRRIFLFLLGDHQEQPVERLLRDVVVRGPHLFG